MNGTLREITRQNLARKKKAFMAKPVQEQIEELYDALQPALSDQVGVLQPLAKQPPGD